MTPPQFSLKRLLVSIALIAVGLVMMINVVRWRWGAADDWERLVLGLISGAVIGAGLFNPFRRPILGAVIGIALPTVLLVLLAFLMLSVLNNLH